MKTRLWAVLLIIPFLAISCKSKDDPVPDPEEVEAVLVIDGAKEFGWDCEGGTATLKFSCDYNWTVYIEKDWITATPAEGNAGDALQTVLTCAPNSLKSARDMYILLISGKTRVPIRVEQAGNPMAGAAPELKSGDVVLATNPLVEKFLTEVDYPDWPDEAAPKKTKIFDYPGGFDGHTLTWDNWETDWPDGDKPQAFSIRWSASDLEAGKKMNLHLSDALGWSGDMEIAAGSLYVNITNLVPNDSYDYKVTTETGKIMAEGSFTTTGSLHQVFFTGPTTKVQGVERKGSGCRNARDLGGWTGLDGKKVKYRKVYRGGRMNEKWTPYPLNAKGQAEVLFEGIGGELDLRGNSDVIFEPAVPGLAHCAPVIEEGGKTMLITYKAQTKECFEFVLDCVRNDKPVYFHCSLGRDRTGTLDVLLLGLLGVREGVIAKEYEVTYFAPVGYSVSSSDVKSNPIPTFRNTRLSWVYSDVVPYFWELAGEGGTFAQGVEKYLLDVAGVSQDDIDEFRSLMLE